TSKPPPRCLPSSTTPTASARHCNRPLGPPADNALCTSTPENSSARRVTMRREWEVKGGGVTSQERGNFADRRGCVAPARRVPPACPVQGNGLAPDGGGIVATCSGHTGKGEIQGLGWEVAMAP